MHGTVLAGWWWVLLLVAGAGEFPLRMATEGRVQLEVGSGVPPLTEVVAVGGKVSDGSWLATKAERERLRDLVFPVSWWRWREAELSFVPQHDGTVSLSLCGPWAESVEKKLFRQEILWESVTAAGSLIEDAEFDGWTEGLPDGWSSPWRPYLKAGEWPITQGAASWHGRPLRQDIPVKKGEVVTLRFKAKAATPPGFVEPLRMEGETAAQRFCSQLKRGVNLGNAWEAEPGTWGKSFTPEDVQQMAAEGFDHIRVPVGWHFQLKDGVIRPEFVKVIEPVLRKALEKGMRVIVDWHHFDALCDDPTAKRGEFVRGWEVLTGHFKEWPDELAFELLNEPRDPLGGELLNEVYAEVIAAIRKIDPERMLVVNPGSWATSDALDLLRLPNDGRIIVSFHCYDPFQFTHQGAEWVGLQDLKGVVYPGGAGSGISKEAFEVRMDHAVAWAKRFGRPIHLGEFGAFREGDLRSRKRYAAEVREACERRGIPWCWWEWNSGFGYWDRDKNEPVFRESLMPE